MAKLSLSGRLQQNPRRRNSALLKKATTGIVTAGPPGFSQAATGSRLRPHGDPARTLLDRALASLQPGSVEIFEGHAEPRVCAARRIGIQTADPEFAESTLLKHSGAMLCFRKKLQAVSSQGRTGTRCLMLLYEGEVTSRACGHRIYAESLQSPGGEEDARARRRVRLGQNGGVA